MTVAILTLAPGAVHLAGADLPCLALPLQLDGLVQQCFYGRMPSALQIEQAIEVTEDAVMPALQQLPTDMQLASADPLAHAIVRAATGGDSSTVLEREQVEMLFNRLADQAARGGAADALLPQDPLWAAALLVLRECLHHWGLHQVQLLPPAKPAR